MAWVVDRGILRLFAQINDAAPGRSKASDGTIGDAAHQAGVSDHNPEHPAPAGNPDYQVDAGDYTHDPAHGADMGVVSESIRVSRDARVKYVIFNRRIFHGTRDAARRGLTAWRWYPYVESDPHTNHMHVSVEDATHDQTQDWQIGIDMPTPEEIAKAVWNLDQIPAPRPPVADPDLATNPTWQADNTLRVLVEEGRERAADIRALAVAVAALAAKIDALEAGSITPGTTFNATVTP